MALNWHKKYALDAYLAPQTQTPHHEWYVCPARIIDIDILVHVTLHVAVARCHCYQQFLRASRDPNKHQTT